MSASRMSARSAGSSDRAPTIGDVVVTWRYGSFGEYWATSRDLSSGLKAMLLTLDGHDADRLRTLAEQALAPYTGDDGALAIPGVTRNVLARKASG